jgi:Putative zinc-finger
VTDQGQCARARQELGVYVLGAIEPAQRAQTGRHLAACPQCRTELAGLAGLPALLRKVRYTPEKWGTELEVRVAGVAAGTRCQLRVTGPHGQQAPAGGWTIPAGQQVTWFPASAPFPATSVHAFEITADRKVLVTIMAPPPGHLGLVSRARPAGHLAGSCHWLPGVMRDPAQQVSDR